MPIHLDNDQGRFYLRLLQDAAARGEAVVYEYHFNDRPVAINLCLVRKGTLIILKTTYDETTQPYSPAQLLLQDLLEELHRAATIRRVEFYGRMDSDSLSTPLSSEGKKRAAGSQRRSQFLL